MPRAPHLSRIFHLFPLTQRQCFTFEPGLIPPIYIFDWAFAFLAVANCHLPASFLFTFPDYRYLLIPFPFILQQLSFPFTYSHPSLFPTVNLQLNLLSTFWPNSNSEMPSSFSAHFFCPIFIISTLLVLLLIPSSSFSSSYTHGMDNKHEVEEERMMLKRMMALGSAPAGDEASYFRHYLNRGMFSCAAKYISILQKMNKLMEMAHQEYGQCKGYNPIQGNGGQHNFDLVHEIFKEDE